jgi:hypothetical protein
MISSRNNYDKIDVMKKLHIQKSINWCEKHDIPCIKLFSSNNIFLSNVYDDGIPISFSKQNNNAFLKGKSSNFTNNVYIGSGGGNCAYNKNKAITATPETITATPETITATPETIIDETSSTEN